MRSKLSLTLAAVLALGFSACSDDKKPEEPVQPTADQGAPATPPPAAEAQPAGGNFAAETVFFGFDDYSLNSDGQEKLKKMADHMKSSPKAVVQIEGHCDERGSIEYNLALGERRAQSAKNFLTQVGVEGSRVTTISYGEEKPVDSGHDEAAWAKNRRDEFNVSSN